MMAEPDDFPTAKDGIPVAWHDEVTGKTIIRLSAQAGTSSLYFHQHAYSHDGQRMVVSRPDGIGVIELASRRNSLILADPGAEVLMVGRQTSRLWYIDGNGPSREVRTIDLEGRQQRSHYRLSPSEAVFAVNADETLLLGSETHEGRAFNDEFTSGSSEAAGGKANPQGEWMVDSDMYHPVTGRRLTFAEQKEVHINRRLERRLPMTIFVVDLKTGLRRDVYHATDWLNHLQFSPTDPQQIMFCHEGPWHKVDRIWTMRLGNDPCVPLRVHSRSMNMEIAGHEFFGHDGQTIWYDLQTPRGEVFWLAGYELESGRRHWYALERDFWSVHFNVSPDGSCFAGDGGDEEMVAHAKDGKWISLFVPEAIPDVAGISADNAGELISPGVLRAVRLVDMKRHNYRLEPNLSFTPDGKRLVFRSNMHGDVHTYAVDVG